MIDVSVEEFPLLSKYMAIVKARVRPGMNVAEQMELMDQPIDVTQQECDAIRAETPPIYRFINNPSGDFVASAFGLGGSLRFHVVDAMK